MRKHCVGNPLRRCDTCHRPARAPLIGTDQYRYFLHMLAELPGAQRVEDSERLPPTHCTEVDIGETIRRDLAFR